MFGVPVAGSAQTKSHIRIGCFRYGLMNAGSVTVSLRGINPVCVGDTVCAGVHCLCRVYRFRGSDLSALGLPHHVQ